MNFNNENNIMNNKSIDSNARKALEQYKLEISSELNNFSSDEFPYVGGIATRKLVEMGERALINEYNNKQN
ncbi:small, acid-soluble spore protein, alpha/beta type [Romboutsia faecis]|nr:small, acid-soluble spore protein, alpha/beta type [Romboutsia faecis]